MTTILDGTPGPTILLLAVSIAVTASYWLSRLTTRAASSSTRTSSTTTSRDVARSSWTAVPSPDLRSDLEHVPDADIIDLATERARRRLGAAS